MPFYSSQVVQTYRSTKKDESHCDLFHLSVTVKGELEYSKSNIMEEVTLNNKLNMN